MRKSLLLCAIAMQSLCAMAQTFSGGTGTEADPYQISKAADFEELSTWTVGYRKSFEGQFFKLTTDVAFTEEYWNQIGSEKTPFQGVVDGDGHTLRGVWLIADAGTNYGIFSFLGEHAVIKNLQVDAPNFTSSQKYTGILVSVLAGSIENCQIIQATFDASKAYYMGGIAGYVRETGSIKNCSFSGQVTTSTPVGGIAGYCAGAIENCYCNATFTSTSTTSNCYIGGIAHHVRNSGEQTAARIVNSTFEGKILGGRNNYVAGIAAQASLTTVSDCRNRGLIVADGYAAGIVASGNESVITRCVNENAMIDAYLYNNSTPSGTLSTPFMAGILAYGTACTVEQCWNGGDLQTAYYSVGGIVGNFISGTIRDCCQAAGIMARNTSFAGGIAGARTGNGTAGTIERCLNYGSVANASAARVKNCEIIGGNADFPSTAVVLAGNHFDEQASGWNVGSKGGLSTAEMTSGTLPDGFDAAVWTCENGRYPRLTWDAQNELAILCATPYYLAGGEWMGRVKSDFTVSAAQDVTWDVGNAQQVQLKGATGSVTRGAAAELVTLTSRRSDYSKNSYLVIYPTLFAGEGTPSDPYLINNYADLKQLAAATNEQHLDFKNEFLKITEDIDMAGGSDYQPIGHSELHVFNGTLDGGNHAIRQWNVATQSSGIKNVALIAWTGADAAISNLVMDKSCTFNTCGYFAPFVYSLRGHLDHCLNLADISSTVGQVSGVVYRVNSDATVNDCYNEGSITSSLASATHMAGIAVLNYGTVDGCDNAGNLTAHFATTKNMGGIAVENHGGINDCLSSGTIDGGTLLGGLVAVAKPQSTLTNSLCTAVMLPLGEVSQVGGAIGSPTEVDARYSNVTFDNQLTIYDNLHAEGITGQSTTGILQSQEDFAGKWVTAQGSYPQLSKFADRGAAVLAAQPVVFAAGDTRRMMSKPAQVTSTQGLTWAIGDNSAYFAIDGSNLTVKESDEYVSAQVVASFNGYQRQIPVSAMGNPFEGDGTEEHPWLITTPSHLVKLSDQVNRSQLSYIDKFFSIENDLDMENVVFTPIAAGTTNKFCGHLMGNNHTISNLNISRGTGENNGLVGYMGEGGEIADLTITGSVVGGLHTGAFVGRGQAKLHNLTNYATINASASNSASVDLMAAGIAGMLEAPCEGTQLTNHGTITGKNRDVAGVVAVVSGDGSTRFTQLYNDGAVSGTIEVGGIGANFSNTAVSNAENHGTVTGTSNMVGGVMGWMHEAGELADTKNYGSVTGLLGVGGVAGRVGGVNLYEDYRFAVKRCLNAGQVTATSRNAGGIVGMTMDIDVLQCANVGNVTNTSTSIKEGYAGAGGIVGLGVPNMNHCYNAGTVSAIENVGGLLGLNSNDSAQFVIANTISNGFVTGFNTRRSSIGALVGGITENGNAENVTFSHVTYDVQLDTLPAMLMAPAAGATPTLTAHLVAADLGGTLGENWQAEEGFYPIPAAFAQEPAVIVTRQPIILHESDNHYRVTHHFSVSTDEGYRWVTDDAMSMRNNRVRFKGTTTGKHELTVTNGEVSRTYQIQVNYVEHFDLNGDGQVDVVDINMLVNLLLGIIHADDLAATATPDITGDGAVDVADINALINYVLDR
ncbi:MAG: dockerin type I repeat-containing protein [Muribaculaceae bacterium]|nr:dockerin type I repeat-containing protein [Muribaculaceae bacterium]